MRILHAGDLHLDSTLAAFDARAAATRRARVLGAFEDVLKKAVREGVELLLLAGDCFDTAVPMPDVATRFFAALGALPLEVVIAPGNHDYYMRGGVWDRSDIPQNVHVFREGSLSFFDFPTLGVTVWGYAFTGERAAAPMLGSASDRPHDRTHILVAHGDMTSPLSPYAPITAGQLEQSGFAYAALGHVHRPPAPRRCGKTLAAYNGFFVGRGFDELGKGSFCTVTLTDGMASLEIEPTECSTFEQLTVDCTGAENGEAVRQQLVAALSAADLPRDTAVRAVLTGEVGLACTPDMAALGLAGEGLALFEVKDRTLPLLDAAYLEKDPTLRGAFYRAMLPRLQEGDEETRAVAARALRLGLAALSGRRAGE